MSIPGDQIQENSTSNSRPPQRHPDVSKTLANLVFEKRNKPQPRLPANVRIQRRPLNHAPIASPYAGSNIQKVVFVSRKTPVMAAVKRVKKLLLHIEERAMQQVNLADDKEGMRKLAEASEKLGKSGEPVLVKASGRAMEQALRVAEWFTTKEDELGCNVEIKTSSVQAIDDFVDLEDGYVEPSEELLEQADSTFDDSTMLQSSDVAMGEDTGHHVSSAMTLDKENETAKLHDSTRTKKNVVEGKGNALFTKKMRCLKHAYAG